MNDKATPRPWRLEPQKSGDVAIICDVRGNHRYLVADCLNLSGYDHDATAEANAAMIVAAVNSYEAHQTLVETARRIVTDVQANPASPDLNLIVTLGNALATIEASK